jgi:hypothetical protein
VTASTKCHTQARHLGMHIHPGSWGLGEKLGGAALAVFGFTAGTVAEVENGKTSNILANGYFVGSVVIAVLGAVALLVGVLGGEVVRRREPPPPPAPGQYKSGQTVVSGDNLNVVVTPTPAHATAQAYPPTVSVGPDNSALVRELQGLRDEGRRILGQVAGGILVRFVGEKAEDWYKRVQLALKDPSQRQRFVDAGPFRSASTADLVNSLHRHIDALDGIINDMCVLPPAYDFHSSP